MSIKNAKAFIKKVKEDENFKSRLSKCKTKEEREKFAKTEGFDFTAQDMKHVKDKGLEFLDNIAGGINNCCYSKGILQIPFY